MLGVLSHTFHVASRMDHNHRPRDVSRSWYGEDLKAPTVPDKDRRRD